MDVVREPRTILAVDDEPFFREEVVDFLRGARFAAQGWTVEAASSGEEALARLVESPYDVMLLDINMPGMDGMDVLKAMQAKHMLDQTYVIILSAYGVYENVVAAMRGGAKDFVNKSEPLDQWVVRIERGFEWQDLRRRQQQAEEELRLLAREVGHDIGGTTFFVLTQRVRALSKLVEGQPEGERSIEVIQQILERIKRLADDLGHVAIALDSNEVWRWESLDLARLLERLVQEFSYGHPNVTIVREWDEDVPPIMGSRAQLERAFHNLLTNAGRAMADGGTLTLRMRRESTLSAFQGEAEDGWVSVDIEDTGVGMSPSDLDKIFRIGFSEWKNGTKGSGLGLYVVHRNIENHCGRIEVSSTIGAGTTVTVHLPVQSKGASPTVTSV
ncbi:MAG TPA: hybrid sensor histidine kinase/response regulator [Chloroflexi bacterium]|nr:hybrid sensor histidine kinase/response regulator [Chloroflexota bacterium]